MDLLNQSWCRSSGPSLGLSPCILFSVGLEVRISYAVGGYMGTPKFGAQTEGPRFG